MTMMTKAGAPVGMPLLAATTVARLNEARNRQCYQFTRRLGYLLLLFLPLLLHPLLLLSPGAIITIVAP